MSGKPAGSDSPRPAGDSPAATARADGGAQVAKPAEVELAILDFDGLKRLIAGKLGRVVVVNVWSTSCPPCVKEFPQLVDLSRRYRPEELACISLSLDYEGIDTPEKQMPKVLKFLQAQPGHVRQRDHVRGIGRGTPQAANPRATSGAGVRQVRDLRRRFDNRDAQSDSEAFTYQQIGVLVSELVNEPVRPAATRPPLASAASARRMREQDKSPRTCDRQMRRARQVTAGKRPPIESRTAGCSRARSRLRPAHG